MQIIADGIRNVGQITQAFPTRDEVVVNGKYVVECPTGINANITEDSYVYPVDGGDLKSLMMEELRVSSGLSYLYFNPFSSSSDLNVIDTASVAQVGVFPAITDYQTRCQQSETPNNTKLLKAVDVTVWGGATERVNGVLLTTAIDISADVPLGADVFLPYWEAHTFNLSHESETDNTPVVKTYQRLEPSSLQVYASTDGGAFWQELTHLSAFTAPAPSTSIQFLFINTSTSRDVYLNAFGFMY